MLAINQFVKEFPTYFAEQNEMMPWEVIKILAEIIRKSISGLDGEYRIEGGIAIHPTAIVESGATLKAPIIISKNCFVGANAYLRGGVFLGSSVTVGPGCEVKSSIIFSKSSLAHFNFIGDSIIGSRVNFEAGALTANHHNDRTDKRISVLFNSSTIETNVEKFGALVGDHSKIGANAVLSPGTLLIPESIVRRLQLVDQTFGS